MSPSEVFERERTDYFLALEACLADIRESHPDAVSELLVELNNLEVPRPYRLMRPDILYKQGEEQKLLRVEKAEGLSFEPLDTSLACGVPMKMHSFRWDKLELRLHGDVNDWLPFEEWVCKWLDVEDIKSTPGADFAGLVHQVSQPVKEDGVWALCIDMGSADLEALNELLGVLGGFELQQIEIGN
ncbi:MAG: hypothetical protein ABL974_01095 [Prosthecobacter sp.]